MNNIIQKRGCANDHKPLVYSWVVGVLAAIVVSELPNVLIFVVKI